MSKTDLIIVGCGGLGRELASMVEGSSLGEKYRVKGYIDDGYAEGTKIGRLIVMGGLSFLDNYHQPINVVIGIGNPALRKKVFDRVNSNSSLLLPNLVHPSVLIQDLDSVTMGNGNIICAGSILTNNISIGDGNLINLQCTIGHDVIIGNSNAIMPGARLSGGCRVENENYIGTNASILQALSLGSNCTVGAGAVVTKSVSSNKTVVGVPANEI